ncbi:MAG: CHAT domain-containing protein [Solirubrobacteraceae bacterium]
MGEREARVPFGMDGVWEALSTRPLEAEVRLAEAGQRLREALLDPVTTSSLIELLDRSPLGTVIDLVFEAEGDALVLPYELLRLPDGRLLATVPGVRMRRRVGGVERAGTPPLPGPLKILVAVGAPEETRTASAPLDIEAEMQAILDAVGSVAGADRAQVTILEVGGPEQIGEALRREQYHVLHLSAHGSPAGVELEDEDGDPVAVTVAELVELLRAGGRPVPLIVLSSCAGAAAGTGGLAGALVHHGGERVLAMQAAVSDGYATKLARALYERLAGAAIPSAALAEARRELEVAARAGASAGGLPVLPEHAVATLLVAGADGPLVDPVAALEPLSRATELPTGAGCVGCRSGT